MPTECIDTDRPIVYGPTHNLKMIGKERYTWHVKIELNTSVSQNVASSTCLLDITF